MDDFGNPEKGVEKAESVSAPPARVEIIEALAPSKIGAPASTAHPSGAEDSLKSAAPEQLHAACQTYRAALSQQQTLMLQAARLMRAHPGPNLFPEIVEALGLGLPQAEFVCLLLLQSFHCELLRGESSRPETNRAEPPRAEPNRAAPPRAESGRPEAGRIEPGGRPSPSGEKEDASGESSALFQIAGETYILAAAKGAEGSSGSGGSGGSGGRAGGAGAPSRAILEAVLAQRKALYVVDAQKDPRWEKSGSVHVRGVRSVLCAPVIASHNLVGLLYLENAQRPDCFNSLDLEALAAFAECAATALENLRQYRRIRQQFEKTAVEAHSARQDRAALLLALRQSEKKFRALFEQGALGSAVVNARTGIIEEANEGLARLVGLARRNLPGKHFRELFASPEFAAIGEWLKLVLQRGEAHAEARLQHSSGAIVSVLQSCRALQLDEGERVLSDFVDITARKRAEQELQTQLRRVTTLQGVSHAFMSTLDIAQLYRLIYEKVRSVIPTDAFMIAVFGRSSTHLRPVFAVDILDKQPQQVPHRDAIDADTPFYQRLLGERKPYRELRRRGCPPPINFMPFGNVAVASASLMYVPMVAGDNVLGMMTAQSYQYNAYEESHLELLLSIATLAAMAIQNARLYDSIRRHREDLQQLSMQILQAQELERGRIARELHDGIGQLLTGMKMNLETLCAAPPAGGAALRERLADAVALNARAIEDLRSISLDLRPSMLDDLGLAPTLEWLVHEVARRHGIAIGVSIDLGGIVIPDAIESAVYRIVQEALANIVNHSGASQASVRLRREGEELLLLISDNGKGFDPGEPRQRARERRGSGLLNMKERTLLLGGAFQLKSRPGEGTQLDFAIPLSESANPFLHPPSTVF